MAWSWVRTGSGALLWLAVCAVARGDGLLPALAEPQVREAQKLLAGFKSSPKGPYLRIRWYCNDGSVHPPAGLPCQTRGGGFQHAELAPAALRLAGWNLDLGVILAGLGFEEFADARRDHHRLKQLVLEQYLVEVDQGWIYRRSRGYRGARQIEDEEKAGRRLLAGLLADAAWVGRRFFLAQQLVAVVPHGAADATVQKIRTLAKGVADRDARFQTIRNRIHSAPSPDDLEAVESYVKERDPAGAAREQALELAELLRRRRAGQELASQIGSYQKKLAGSPLAKPLAELAAALGGRDEARAHALGAALSVEIRRAVGPGSDGRRNLDLLDLNAVLLENGFRAPHSREPNRRRWLAGLLDDVRYAAGAGLLSLRQFEALRAELEALGKREEIEAEAYYQSIRYVARSTEWCRATVAREFGTLARLWGPVEPPAAGLVDHLLRGSVALPLSARLDDLVADANRAVGIRHAVFGQSAGAILALNPGVARGRLGIIEPGQEETAAIDPDRIYVIPETLADLKPMAGILTLDSGNALSHAQLLAANLGIPNASVPSALLPLLRKHLDRELVYAVTPRGMVALREKAGLSAEELKLWAASQAARPRMELDVSRLNLTERRILSLRDLGVKDSGVLVGPKAANLAQLMSYFPEQVAPGLVLPFGIFHQHIERVLDPAAGVTLRQQIYEAFGEAERRRQAGATPAQVGEFIYPRLAQFRKTIRTMPLVPDFEKELLSRMRGAFGEAGSYGVFVRSDTNAEDLPEFTGAGLNLTVPNQVGNAGIVQAVKDVWASPFTERAYDWRAQVLRSQERVVPSVIVMRAVPSDKSGVIGTINLETGAAGEITVNVSEGVSAVVDGGVAESLLLKPNGEVRLLQQARNPYRKVVLPGGGLENQPAGGDDYVLAADEIVQLRRLVAEVDKRYPPARNEAGQVLPWDIEFGFEKGQLRLFQIRPLVRSPVDRTLEALSGLGTPVAATGRVRLEEPL